MISTRFLAALLRFHISLGNRPPAKSLNPRAVLCGMPSTMMALVCHGNAVGMPALRPCVFALVRGINRAAIGRSPRAAVESHFGVEELKPPLVAPVAVS